MYIYIFRKYEKILIFCLYMCVLCKRKRNEEEGFTLLARDPREYTDESD